MTFVVENPWVGTHGGLHAGESPHIADELVDLPPKFEGFPQRWSASPTTTARSSDPWGSYSDSKAANVIFSRAIARRFGDLGVRSIAYVHSFLYILYIRFLPFIFFYSYLESESGLIFQVPPGRDADRAVAGEWRP